MSGPVCSVCTSPHREEIERRLASGESSRSVSAWLKQETGESVWHTSICKHVRSHVVLQTELGKQLAATATPTPASSLSLVPALPVEDDPRASLDTVDWTKQRAQKIAEKLSDELLNEDADKKPVEPFSQVKAILLVAMLKETRTSAKTWHEMRYGKKFVIEKESKESAPFKDQPTDDLQRRRDELLRRRGL